MQGFGPNLTRFLPEAMLLTIARSQSLLYCCAVTDLSEIKVYSLNTADRLQYRGVHDRPVPIFLPEPNGCHHFADFAGYYRAGGLQACPGIGKPDTIPGPIAVERSGAGFSV